MTRNILLFSGIILAILLVGLRVVGQFNPASGDMGMLSGLLGYEEPKQYALVLFDPSQDPLLFLITVSRGDIKLEGVQSADALLKDLPVSEFPVAADVLVERIRTSGEEGTIDALGFVTVDAAGRILDAFEGFYIKDQQINSHNLGTVVSEFTLSKKAVDDFNDFASVHKDNLITNSRAVLLAVKEVFSRGLAAVYFKSGSPFGKPCIGACGAHLFEYLTSGGSLNR